MKKFSWFSLAAAALLAPVAMGKPPAAPAAPVTHPPMTLNEIGRAPVAGGEVMPVAFDHAWWDNGAPDFRNAQNSQTLGAFNARVADDFFLKAGNFYYWDKIQLVMAVSAGIDPVVALELYSDCNGKPDSLITTYTNPIVTPLGPSTTWPGFNLFGFSFENIARFETGYTRYWLSPYGIGQGYYYWITSGNGVVQGVQGQYRSAAYGYPDWTDLDSICCFPICSDYNFRIIGDVCCLLKDNSDFDLSGLGSLQNPNVIIYSSRSADNFQIPPGECCVEVCRIEAWLATNCNPHHAFGEIYTNNCDAPDALLHTLNNPVVINTGLTIAGLPVYRFVFDNPGICLAPGQNYWFSMVALGTGNINERAIFLFKRNVGCHINITEGQHRNMFLGFTNFTPVSNPSLAGTPRDFAFRIYTKVPQCTLPGGGGGRGGSDIDGDGTIDHKWMTTPTGGQ